MVVKKVALGVAYQGLAYYGWQRQRHLSNTVQENLENALSSVADQSIELICAGRTDSGVHATGQVVHFESTAVRSLRAWQQGGNRHLAKTIRIAWAVEVPGDFHARFSATHRRYHYIIEDNSMGNAVYAGLVTACPYPLDAQIMHEAAQCLLGEQDFSSFWTASCQSHSPFRHIDFVNVRRKGRLVVIDIQANAFLYHMVRNIAGALMAVGRGITPVRWLPELLAARDRCQAPATAKANGLYLVEVGYDSVYNLPEPAFFPFNQSG